MLGILLTVVCLAGSPDKSAAGTTAASGTSAPADQAESILRQVAQWPAARQRDWLRHVEQRFNWASQITMPRDDARREELRIEKLLRQPTIPWADLLSIVHQTDQREKGAVAKLVRQYRKAVYNRYQTQPRTLQERQEAWYRVWSAWEASGSPVGQQDRLLDWLAEAIRTTSHETDDRLPADPKFGPGPESESEPPQLAGHGPSANRPSDHLAGVVDRPLMLWRTSAPPTDSIVDRLAATAPPDLGIEEIKPRRALISADTTSLPRNAAAVRLRPQTPRGQRDETVVAALAESELVARHDSGVQIRPDAIPSLGTTVQIVSEIRGNSRLAGDASSATPSLENANIPRGIGNEIASEPQSHAQVNVDELTSRIAGVNLSLRMLEGELSVKQAWSVDQLEALAQRLDILILRQKDLALFRDLITPAERAKAGAIDSPKAALAAISARVSALRVHFQTAAPADDDTRRTEILRQLESLADRLTALTSDAQ